MAINRNGQATKYKFLHNGRMLKKGFHNSTTLIWSAGSTVTYKVDTGVEYTEEVDSGATCLAPKTFTPTKDGWTFVGWREDSTASGDVLTNKVMDSEPITLYAVFKQTVTTNWISGEAGATKKTVTGTNYYNNGNIGYATLDVPTPASYSGWTWRGWSYNGKTEANASVDPNKDAETLTSVDGTRTYYGLYQKTITRTFVSGKDTTKVSTPVTGTVYYNAVGNTKNASITPPTPASISGWMWKGWSGNGSTGADASVNTSLNSAFGADTDGTHYGLYEKTITVNFYSGLSKATHNPIKGTGYYNSSGNLKNVSVTVPTGATVSGWSWRGWTTHWDDTANASVAHANGVVISNINPENDGITYFGLYQQTITLSYNGNGATGGSTSNQTGTRYHNSAGNYKNPSFALRGNGYTKTNHAFQKWAQGSAGGTQYASGASVTLSANTTFYAVWQLVPLTLFDNGTLRSGDSFHPYSTWDNADNDDSALREASCGNTLYAYGRTSNYDRYSIAGGIFAQAIDLSGFTKLRVTLNSASIVSSNNSRWFAGLRNNWFNGGNNAGIPYLDNCVILSTETGGTFSVDLTAYKNAYGNTAHFLFGAGKVNRNSPNGGAWVHIAKVWLE